MAEITVERPDEITVTLKLTDRERWAIVNLLGHLSTHDAKIIVSGDAYDLQSYGESKREVTYADVAIFTELYEKLLNKGDI